MIFRIIRTAYQIVRFIHKERKREKECYEMPIEDLRELTGDDFLEVLWSRILYEEGDMEPEESLTYFQGAKRTFYIIEYFDMEVQNGGLCQFFVNSSKEVAPYLLDSLEEVQAFPYKELLEKFVRDNGILLDDLSSFVIEDFDELQDEFAKQSARYPFEEFDDAYYELYGEEPLGDFLEKYCKEHIGEFA